MFEITYYSQKDKMTVSRLGKHDDKSREFQSSLVENATVILI